MKFDSSRWKAAGGENITLDIRAKMVDDLIESEVLLNKDKSQLIDLIGSSEKLNTVEYDSILYFPVQEKYGLDIDPKEMTFLKITMNNKGESVSVVLHSTK
ncbi:hypothetical protein [Flagellimonas iocasae]|uniref:Uncharacterized protein n=1 Tax=Flagellimonas iocasae TaxID=2055905 RepID=A0ABW4XWX7_9FLAO